MENTLRKWFQSFSLMLSLLLCSCVSLPQGISAVDDFQLERYLGRWYEIARLDHSFERGLSLVTAEYSLRDDGGVKVINRGYDAISGRWKTAEGRAYFVAQPQIGRLKVSFFGPFYGAYNIIALDRQDYSHVMICGPDRSYLWILARTPPIEQAVLEQLVAQAGNMGFETHNLTYVEQAVRGQRPAEGGPPTEQ